MSAAAASPAPEGDRQHFLDTVFAMVRDGLPPDSLASLFEAQYGGLDEACMHSPARCGHVALFTRQSGHLVALVKDERESPSLDQRIALAAPAAQRLQRLLQRLKLQHRQRCPRRPYAEDRCGHYPLRDATHDEVRVLEAAELSEAAHSGRRYRFAEVEPFVRPATSRRARAALYLGRLAARPLKPADLLMPGEASLVGQQGLFATAAIPAGTCLGVYGGQLLRDKDWLFLPDDRYLLALDPQGRVRLDGETLLSLANTLYLDAQALVQAEDGYNAELAKFPARLAHGWDEACVPALFALHDIAPGEEIRWNYGIGRA